MNQEDYPSDSDASDEDFRPDKEEAETGSEVETDDDEPAECDEQLEKNAVAPNGIKRKRKPPAKGRKKSKISDKAVKAQEKAHQSDNEENEELNEEEEKRRTDALWADFLGGGSNSASTATEAKDTTNGRNSKTKPEPKNPVAVTKPTPKPSEVEKDKATVAQLFEFAGEQILLTQENNSKSAISSDKEQVPTLASVSKTVAPKGIPSRGISGSSGGLGAVLSQISKKNKLTTLEKTKLDWTSFKRQEGIEEELHTHNKGKDGFLERRDFLERTDVRQFEIEKSFRQTKRSNR